MVSLLRKVVTLFFFYTVLLLAPTWMPMLIGSFTLFMLLLIFVPLSIRYGIRYMTVAETATLEMTCGKGGYVRAIARDLGIWSPGDHIVTGADEST